MREIRYEVCDSVATVTIDRPEKCGAMTYAMLDEFSACVARAGADETVRVLLVTGVPGSFCAGIDLADLAAREPRDRGRADGPDLAGADREPDELPAAAERLTFTIASASPSRLCAPRSSCSTAGANLRAHVAATRVAMTECFASADHAEGVASFIEKRPARFTGH